MTDKWWGTRSRPSKWMMRDILAMNETFLPGKMTDISTHTSWDQDYTIQTLSRDLVTEGVSYPYWLLKVQILEKNGPRSKPYVLKITYPDDYPYKEPRVTLPEEDISGVPHVFNANSDVICLWDHRTIQAGWDPATSTAATFGLWGMEWIRAWTYWRKRGRWPENG